MKKAVSILAAVLLGWTLQAQQVFGPGEDLRFSVMYKWGAVNTEVAQASAVLDKGSWKGRESLYSCLELRTAPFFDVFYKMRDKFQGWFLEENLLPIHYERSTRENNYSADNTYDYDWKAGKISATLAYNGAPAEVKDIEIGRPTVCDVASLLYFFRRTAASAGSMTPGQEIPVHFVIDDEVFDLTMTYQGKEVKRIRKIGKFNCLRFSCTVLSGTLFDGKDPLMLWFSDDGNCVPMAFNAPLKIGAVQGWLSSSKNLTNPFSAKL